MIFIFLLLYPKSYDFVQLDSLKPFSKYDSINIELVIIVRPIISEAEIQNVFKVSADATQSLINMRSASQSDLLSIGEMLALFECGTTRSEAVVIENFIKKQKSKKLLLKLIDPDFIPADKLAMLVRVPHA